MALLYSPVTIFIFGAVIGSFLKVCIARIPEGLFIVLSTSRCSYSRPHPLVLVSRAVSPVFKFRPFWSPAAFRLLGLNLARPASACLAGNQNLSEFLDTTNRKGY